MKQQLSEQFSRMKKLAGINENFMAPKPLPPASGEHNPSTLWDSLDLPTRTNALEPIVGPEDAGYLARYSWNNIPGGVANQIEFDNIVSHRENTPSSFLDKELNEILALINEAEKKSKEEEEEEEAPAEEEETPAEGEDETPAEDEAPAEGEDVEGEEGLDPEVKKIQSALELAYAKAKALNDKKLNAQIGNTITYFTKTQVLKAEEGEGEEGGEVTEDLFSSLVREIAIAPAGKPKEDPNKKQAQVKGSININAFKKLNVPGANIALLTSGINKIKQGSSVDKLSTSEKAELAKTFAEMIRTKNDSLLNQIFSILKNVEQAPAKAPVTEKKLSKVENSEKEKIVKGMKKNKSEFVKDYGKDAQKVMYATATKLAQKKK
jgi:hypothetical protein